ncbi:MAG: hypothetical protein V3R80_12560 [Candidatus Tectomicrobia bacterium]
MKQYLIAVLALSTLLGTGLDGAEGSAGAKGDTGDQGASGVSGVVVPGSVLINLNINADDTNGASTRSLMVIEADTDQMWNFPFTGMTNNSADTTATDGQPMHGALHPNRRWVYVTMGGSATLALRLLVIDLGWEGGMPMPTITKSVEILASGNDTQQAHGTRMTEDGHFLLFSEMNNNTLRVFDTWTNDFITGGSYSHASLKTPHGAWPNASSTIAVAPQYEYGTSTPGAGGDAVSVWTMLPGSGALTFSKTITLTDGGVKGAFPHTVAWLDDNEFYTGATHDTSEAPASTFEQSVFLVNVSAGTATAVLGKWDGSDESSGVKEGVSDVVIANGNLYVCEGNVNNATGAGYVSVWSIAGNGSLTFVKRLGANTGLPASFKQCHGLMGSRDGRWVFAQSFISNHLVKISSMTNMPARIWDSGDGLSLPHGFYAN